MEVVQRKSGLEGKVLLKQEKAVIPLFPFGIGFVSLLP